MPDIQVAIVYPELLSLYADRGNAIALRHRARLRGITAEIIEVHIDEAMPASADFYLLGGAEDATMSTALRLLRKQRALARAVDHGASVLGVCAGYQMLGHSFVGPDGATLEGLGILDVESRRLADARAIGEVVIASPTLGDLQGFENHRGDARLGPAARPLGALVSGVGNGDGATEGAVQGNVVGTYLHGPALVRNPALADMFLAAMTGRSLAPLDDELVEQLRAERREHLRGRLRARFWRRR